MHVLVMMSSVAMGGGERNVVSILPPLKQAGVDVMLCTLNTRRDSLLVEDFNRSGITRFDLQARRMMDLGSWRRFSALLRNQSIDLIHAQDQDTIIYAGLAHRLLNIPTVMTRHVLKETAYSWKTALRARMVFWSARYEMKRIVAVSDAVRHEFARQTGISYSKIETIYNGIELERFDLQQDRSEARKKLGWDLQLPIVILVSVLRPGKGFDVLFDALPRIQAAVPEVQIKVVGGGELEAELREQAKPFGDVAVEFLGSRMDIPELLRASDILIQTSWSEALPTVLIEAGAASLPVVATNVGGTREIVQDGVGGYIVEPGDAANLANRVVDILKNRALADAMGKNAHSHVFNTFTLNKQALQLKALYKKTLVGIS